MLLFSLMESTLVKLLSHLEYGIDSHTTHLITSHVLIVLKCLTNIMDKLMECLHVMSTWLELCRLEVN